jgi:hypothetical protein
MFLGDKNENKSFAGQQLLSIGKQEGLANMAAVNNLLIVGGFP